MTGPPAGHPPARGGTCRAAHSGSHTAMSAYLPGGLRRRHPSGPAGLVPSPSRVPGLRAAGSNPATPTQGTPRSRAMGCLSDSAA
jgi:hypothetical protein